MEKFVYFSRLFDCYRNLLSKNEKKTFSAYYEENLSMQEIAEIRKISKSAIGSTIKNTELKLVNYENALHLQAKQERMRKILKHITDEKIRQELEKIMK